MPDVVVAPRSKEKRHRISERWVLRWLAVCACAPVVTGCPQLLSGDFQALASSENASTSPSGGAGSDSGGAPNTLPPSSTATGGGNGGASATGSDAGGANAGTPGGNGGGSITVAPGGATNGGSTTATGGPSTGGEGGTGGVSAMPDAGAIAGSGGTANTCVEETETCDGRDNDCDDEIDEEACEDTCFGFIFDGHGYMSCNTLRDADGAREACEAEGMYLVEIASEEENNAVLAFAPVVDDWDSSTYFGPTAGAYMGATASSDLDEWRWAESNTVFYSGDTSVPGVYSNWGDGQPNNTTGDQTCAGFYVEDGNNGNAGEWNDADCRAELAYVCEAD